MTEKPAGSWRPIETAPTDGRAVLLMIGRDATVGTYDADRAKRWPGMEKWCWRLTVGDVQGDSLVPIPPTYWQTIPDMGDADREEQVRQLARLGATMPRLVNR